MATTTQKKPPDPIRTVKSSFKSIIKPELNQGIIFDAVNRTHQIVIHTYQFLRLWILNKYHTNQELPIITTDIISMAMKALVPPSAGPKPKGTNLKYYNEFLLFYNDTYKSLNYETKISGSNLSQILGYMTTDIITNIENNVKLNFISYVKRFVNSSFRIINNEILNNVSKKDKISKRKELNQELYQVKEDLLNNTLNSNEKYHEWINKHRPNIFPTEYTNSYEYDIECNPQKYLKYMIYMCLELEHLEVKSFQFFPLRTDIIPKYIPIDTTTLVDLMIDKNKNKYFKNIENEKNNIWLMYFNLELPIFKQKNYQFDYRISTDCFGVSIQLIHNDSVQLSKDKKANMKAKRNSSKELYKTMSQEEKEAHKAKLAKQQKETQDNYKLELKQKKDKEKANFKKLTKEEQKKVIGENKKKKFIEFPYLEDLDNNQLEELNTNKWVVIDPGKRVLLYMKDKEGNKFRYSNKQHVDTTKRLKYQRLLQNYRNKNDISNIENELSNYNSKTCKYDAFKLFISNKNRLNNILLSKYQEEIFRKYKWYSYINKKKSETTLIRNIKQKYGNDSILIMGDYSDKNCANKLKGKMSTPNLGLKRKLGEYFTVYTLDEFRTSCLNYKTEEKCENLYLPDKKGVIRSIHSILTYQTENNRMGCINRDENATNNMIKLVNYFLKNKDRPQKFKRDFKFEEEIKDDNPNLFLHKLASNIVMPVKVQLHQLKRR